MSNRARRDRAQTFLLFHECVPYTDSETYREAVRMAWHWTEFRGEYARFNAYFTTLAASIRKDSRCNCEKCISPPGKTTQTSEGPHQS